MSFVLDHSLWAGSEESYHQYLSIIKKAEAEVEARGFPDDDDDEAPRLLQVMDDGTAIIKITGVLNNTYSWINRWFGMTGYPEIREALIAAAEDSNVKRIALDISSPGGTTSGLSDTSDLIHLIHTTLKPVSAFTESMMASAAYWLGCSAGKIMASRLAIVGSIGVMAVHQERSKYLKDQGIGVTVIRSGPYKALTNPYEPLSEEGKKQLQAQVDAADAVFVEHVASMRGRSVDYTREHMAQGREFTAEDAQRVGLIDKVCSFDEWIEDISQEKIDPLKKFTDTSGQVARGYSASAGGTRTGEEDMKKKRALTEQDIAALAAGASIEAVAGAGASIEDDASEAAAAAAAAAGGEGETGEEASTTEAASPTEAGAGEVAKTEDGLTVLKAQLRESQDELLEARIENRTLADKVAKLEAIVNPMKDIVAKSVGNMMVALGGSAIDLSAMSAEAVLSEHMKLDEQFRRKFQVGGVAAVSASDSERESVGKVDGLTHARMAAVRNQKKG